MGTGQVGVMCVMESINEWDIRKMSTVLVFWMLYQDMRFYVKNILSVHVIVRHYINLKDSQKNLAIRKK